jgi:hypothetical protein
MAEVPSEKEAVLLAEIMFASEPGEDYLAATEEQDRS